jgi:hypothetical protein
LWDDEGADGVVARAAAGVADDVRVALTEACELGGVKPRVHAGEDGEAARGGHREPRLGAEVLRVNLVRREHLVAYLGHHASPFATVLGSGVGSLAQGTRPRNPLTLPKNLHHAQRAEPHEQPEKTRSGPL